MREKRASLTSNLYARARCVYVTVVLCKKFLLGGRTLSNSNRESYQCCSSIGTGKRKSGWKNVGDKRKESQQAYLLFW